MSKFNNKTPEFLISGYYGHGNFGDEAILKAIVTELRSSFPGSGITVVSNSPESIKKLHQVETIHKYDVSGILKGLMRCDMFISGGGSLLQDVTSFKSLCYYLALLFTAQVLGKKTFVYAQGIGPLKSNPARILTACVLNKTGFITVRDKNSAELLNSMGISSTVTADPVWGLEQEVLPKENTPVKVGVQLRKWASLDETGLHALAEAAIANFKDAQLQLISLQEPDDRQVSEKFREILRQNGFWGEINLISGLNTEDTINCIAGLDYLIGMRYHALLVAARYGVPSLALAYDPKVSALARETSFPCISIEDFENFDRQIKLLKGKKEEIKAALQEISDSNLQKSMQTVTYLRKILF